MGYIAMEIIANVQAEGGRFLKLTDGGGWEVVDDADAR
jgi:hypothetical protein